MSRRWKKTLKRDSTEGKDSSLDLIPNRIAPPTLCLVSILSMRRCLVLQSLRRLRDIAPPLFSTDRTEDNVHVFERATLGFGDEAVERRGR